MPELEDLFGTNPPAETPPEPSGEPAASVPPAAPETQATPAAPAAPAEPAQPSFADSGLYARARSAGLDLDGVNDPNAFAEVLLDRYMAERPYADHGRASLAVGKRPEEQHNQGDPQRDTQEDNSEFDLDGHFSSLWSVPQVDDQAKFLIQSGIVQLGEDGLFAAKPGYEAMALPVLNNLNQAHVARQEQVKALFEGNFYQNIDKGLWPAVEHRVQKMLEERLGQRFQSYTQEQQAQGFEQQFINENKNWLHDANGRLTADGEKFKETVAELREQGITDPRTLANYALKISGVNTNAGAQAASPGAPGPTLAPNTGGQEKPRDGQGRFLPAGTPAPLGPQKTKQESFMDDARRKASASSSQGSYTETGGDAVVANEGELENMFTNDWKRYKEGAAA